MVITVGIEDFMHCLVRLNQGHQNGSEPTRETEEDNEVEEYDCRLLGLPDKNVGTSVS